jgi:hypothetical protein
MAPAVTWFAGNTSGLQQTPSGEQLTTVCTGKSKPRGCQLMRKPSGYILELSPGARGRYSSSSSLHESLQCIIYDIES